MYIIDCQIFGSLFFCLCLNTAVIWQRSVVSLCEKKKCPHHQDGGEDVVGAKNCYRRGKLGAKKCSKYIVLSAKEVKAEQNVRANSLSNLLKSTPTLHAVRYSMKPYIEQENLTCIPLYAVM